MRKKNSKFKIFNLVIINFEENDENYQKNSK